jgi:hypothetical protein
MVGINPVENHGKPKETPRIYGVLRKEKGEDKPKNRPVDFPGN